MPRLNRITATFSTADKTSVIAKLNEAKVLMPFLNSLNAEERKKLRKMGPKSLAYVDQCIEGATAFPDEMKANFDLKELEKDYDLVSNLLGVRIICQALTELIDDTMMAAGIDAMGAADEVYASLKSSAKSNANVKAMVELIGKRFEGQGTSKESKK